MSTLAAEALLRPNAAPLHAWLRAQPLEVAVDLGLATLVGLLLLSLVGRLMPAAALWLLLLGAMSLVHVTKLEVLGRPLYPWDVLLFREGFAVASHVGALRWAICLTPGLAFALISIRVRGPRSSLPVRLVLLVMALGTSLAIWPHPDQRFARLGVEHHKWVQPENYLRNGLLLAFVINLGSVAVEKPKGYGAPAVRKALSLSAAARAEPTAVSAGEKPNVILVMSEAFFDATVLPGVSFRDDPLPHFHALEKEGTRLGLFVPVFGGGTANTEFEVLTGLSMRFLPQGSIPYQQYLRGPTPSLASHFVSHGYRAVAVHNYYRWFWERDRVYPALGFQRFEGLEDMPDVRIDGEYPSDSAITQAIFRELDTSEAPLFLFAVSVEAHGPYSASRYPDEPPWIVEGPLDDEARGALDAYTTAIHHADRELGAVVARLRTSRRPSWLFFFGDHLPSLLGVLDQTGYKRPSDGEGEFRHQVPLLIWNSEGQRPPAPESFSASYLSPLVLDAVGLQGTAYIDFLRHVRTVLPLVMPGLVADASGARSAEPPEALQGLIDDWRTLQYDILFGEQYLLQEPLDG